MELGYRYKWNPATASDEDRSTFAKGQVGGTGTAQSRNDAPMPAEWTHKPYQFPKTVLRPFTLWNRHDQR